MDNKAHESEVRSLKSILYNQNQEILQYRHEIQKHERAASICAERHVVI